MNITIDENLKKFRREKGNTQEDLAEYLAISFQAISKWERGESLPDITLMPKIAAYYNVSVDDLFGVGKIRIYSSINSSLSTNLLFISLGVTSIVSYSPSSVIISTINISPLPSTSIIRPIIPVLSRILSYCFICVIVKNIPFCNINRC